MRSYFQCHIGGSRLFVPWLLALVLAAGASAAVRLVLPEPQADPVFDGRFLLGILGYMLGGICLLAAQCLVYYRFVQATLRGSSLYGEAIEAEYDPKRYLRLCAKNILLSVVTCGIWLPWMVVSLIRYFASPVIHRLFLCEEPIYRGRGSVLFAYGVLFGVVPVVIIPFAAACFVLTGGMAVSGVLLLIVAVGLLACLKALTLRYFVNFEVGRKRLCTTIRSWRAGGFVFGQFLLLVLTCGIYAPMALLRIWRYYADRTVLGEERGEIRFGFSSNGLRDYGRLLLQWLLVAVTAGLYFPWGYARTMELLIGHTYVEEVEPDDAELMPADYR